MRAIIITAILWVGVASAKTIDLKIGELPVLMSEIKLHPQPELILTGEAEAQDLTALRELPREVTRLDMSKLNVSSIPPYMLVSTNVSELVLPHTIDSIGEGAFASTPLTRLDMTRVVSIGKSVFYGCMKLVSVDMGNTKITEIPDYAFAGCSSLTRLNLPGGISKIGPKGFYGTGLQSLLLADVSSVGDYAFAMCPRLDNVILHSGCEIGEGAFFYDASMQELPYSITTEAPLVATGAGADAELMIGGGKIGEGAYSGSGIRNIMFLAPVNTIDAYAFHNMANLDTINVIANGNMVPNTDLNAFAGTNVRSVQLVVAKNTEDQWKEAPIWRDFIITSSESGIAERPGEGSGISIFKSGDTLNLESSLPIEAVIVYDLSGKILMTEYPNKNSCSYTLPAGDGIYMVKASTSQCTKVEKIL